MSCIRVIRLFLLLVVELGTTPQTVLCVLLLVSVTAPFLLHLISLEINCQKLNSHILMKTAEKKEFKVPDILLLSNFNLNFYNKKVGLLITL